MLTTVAPEAVKVRAEPSELKPGVEATLYCDSASSNPPATLSWWRDGIPVQGTDSIPFVLYLSVPRTDITVVIMEIM